MSEQKLAVEHDSVKKMSEIERSEAQMRVAMTDKEHLRRWLHESGRRWLVLNGDDLVDALWPTGIEALMLLVACYRDHRATLPSSSGELVEQKVPGTNEVVRTPKPKPETLEINELDRAIRYLIAQASEMDPNWSLSGGPL